MTTYLAIYRVHIKPGSRLCRREFYDDAYAETADTDDHYVSMALDIGTLDDSQLDQLRHIIEQKYRIQVRKSEDWNVDRNEHGVIFLMDDSVYKDLGKNLGAEIKNELKYMRSRYALLMDQPGRCSPSVTAPLSDCRNHAIDIRGAVQQPPTTTAPVKRKRLTPEQNTSDSGNKGKKPEYTDEQKEAALKYAFATLKDDPTIPTNKALADRIHDRYPGVQEYDLIRWCQQKAGISFTKEAKKIRKAHVSAGLGLPTSMEVPNNAQSEVERKEELEQTNKYLMEFCRREKLPPMTFEEFADTYPFGSATGEEFVAFCQQMSDFELGIGWHGQFPEDMDKDDSYD